MDVFCGTSYTLTAADHGIIILITLSATCNIMNIVFLSQDLLVTIFENGNLVKEYSFEEIRERAELPLVKKRRKERLSS